MQVGIGPYPHYHKQNDPTVPGTGNATLHARPPGRQLEYAPTGITMHFIALESTDLFLCRRLCTCRAPIPIDR